MIPTIFNLGPLPLNSFGLAIALAILAGVQTLQHSFRNNGINPRLAEKYVFLGGLIGIVAARLWYVFIEDYDQLKHNLAAALLSSAGFTFYGGFIVAALSLLLISRIDKIPFSNFIDSFGPTLALAYAIGRLGCQLSGDGDYGIATTNFLGMSFAEGIVPTPPGILVYPTPLYESIWSGLVALYLFKIELLPQWQTAYSRFGAYLVLLGLERFCVEIIRINPEVAGQLSQAQIVAILLILIGAPLLLRRFVLSPKTN